MKFKVISGTHIENGKTYTKGQVVESHYNLANLFTGKFTQIGVSEEEEEEPETTSHAVKKSAISTKAASGRKAGSKEKGEGDDWTDKD